MTASIFPHSLGREEGRENSPLPLAVAETGIPAHLAAIHRTPRNGSQKPAHDLQLEEGLCVTEGRERRKEQNGANVLREATPGKRPEQKGKERLKSES